MSIKDCIARVNKASEGIITTAQADTMIREMADQANVVVDTQLWRAEDKILFLAKHQVALAEVEAAYARRASLLNAKAVDKISKYITKSVEHREISRSKAFVYYMLGSPRLLKTSSGEVINTRDSVGARQTALRQEYYGNLEDSLETIGATALFRSGELDEEVFKELWSMARTRDLNKGVTGVPAAYGIAKGVYDLRLKMLGRENLAGGITKLNDTYAMRQTHDIRRIMKGHHGDARAARAAWIENILPLLDEKLTFDGVVNRDYYIENIFDNIIAGEHTHAKPTADTDNSYARPGSLAKRLSSHRVLHFKDAASAWEYNQKFGGLSIRDGIVTEISHHSSATVMMETFGADPDGTFSSILKHLVEQDRDTRTQHRDMTSSKREPIGPRLAFDTLMGYKDVPENITISRVRRSLMGVQTLAKMGGITITAFADKPIMHSTLTYNGIENSKAFLAGLKVFVPKTEIEKHALRQMGVGADSFIGQINARVGTNEPGMGGIYQAQQRLFKLIGMHWWNDAHKGTAGLMIANEYALSYKTPFDKLKPDLQTRLKQYGIDEEGWKSIRGAAIYKAEDGNRYLTPDGIMNLPDAQADMLVPDALRGNVNARVRAKNELALRLRTLLTDQVDDAVITPGAREKIITSAGTQAGTFHGAIARMFGHFKSFPVAVVNKILMREAMGHEKGAAGILRANWRVIQLIASTTVMGYLSMSVKDALGGRGPRELYTDGEINWDVLRESMIRGGGGGMYADLLLTQYDQAFNHPAKVLAGPTLGALADGLVLASQGVYGAVSDEGDMPSGKRVLQYIKGNTPYANIFYLKPAVDLLVLHAIDTYFQPGYVYDYEENMEERNHQEFFLPPSDILNK